MTEMRKTLRILSIAVFASALLFFVARDRQDNVVRLGELELLEGRGGIKQEYAFEQYQRIDLNLFGSGFLSQEIVDRAAEDLVGGKDGFAPVVLENSSFPEGLVVKMEEILYRIREGSVLRAVWEELDLEFRLTDTEELNRLFPKASTIYGGATLRDSYDLISRYYDIPEGIVVMYHMELLPGKDNYLFEVGIKRFPRYKMRMTERIGDKFLTVCEFDLPEKESVCGVIRYGDKFYLIAGENGVNAGEERGYTIYRLGYGSPGDSISIRSPFQSEEYAVESYDADSAEIQAFTENGYIDKVLQDFSSGKYLHEGNREDGAKIYYGDEEFAFDWVSEGITYKIYRMDVANCGCPVYLCKDMYLPKEDMDVVKNLGVDFFYFDTEKFFFRKLEELSIPQQAADYGEVGYLVQMWFKEMEGKVYTFRVYNLSHYNYLMDIALVEGDKVTSIGTYFLWAKNKFALEEKQALYPEENVVQGEEHFKVTYEGDFKYHYMLYGRDGNVLKEGEGEQPRITYIDEETIVLEEYGEGKERHTVYYDIVDDRLSETYLNPVAAGYGKVAYLKGQGEDAAVVVRKMFDAEYYKEFPLGFEAESLDFAFFPRKDRLHMYYNSKETGKEESQKFELDVN